MISRLGPPHGPPSLCTVAFGKHMDGCPWTWRTPTSPHTIKLPPPPTTVFSGSLTCARGAGTWRRRSSHWTRSRTCHHHLLCCAVACCAVACCAVACVRASGVQGLRGALVSSLSTRCGPACTPTLTHHACRYHLVNEALAERAHMLDAAPFMVKPLPIMVRRRQSSQSCCVSYLAYPHHPSHSGRRLALHALKHTRAHASALVFGGCAQVCVCGRGGGVTRRPRSVTKCVAADPVLCVVHAACADSHLQTVAGAGAEGL
jgi:hypothetical protein